MQISLSFRKSDFNFQVYAKSRLWSYWPGFASLHLYKSRAAFPTSWSQWLRYEA